MKQLALALTLIVLSVPRAAHAVAYGSINNFDAVNDNGVPCHGFEIEIDGAHSTDVTYTYDWNHYGVPKITEDNSTPTPRCLSAMKARRTRRELGGVHCGPLGSDLAHRRPSVHQPQRQFRGRAFWRRFLRDAGCREVPLVDR